MSKNEANTKDYTYFHERLDPIGWTPENGVVKLPADVAGDRKEHVYDLFDVDDEGNLLLNYYLPTGVKAQYKRGTSNVSHHYQVVRWRNSKVRADGSAEKYKHPSGVATMPWFSPNIIEAFNTKRHVQTLVMTEGVLKGFAGYVHGLHMVSFPGIQNTKDRNTGTLHNSLEQVLKVCKPKEVVWLHDGDCKRLSNRWPEDPNVDLYERPNSFFTSARNMGELLKDLSRMLGFRSYYMHVVSEAVQLPRGMEAPKGLDDLLLAYPLAKAQQEVPSVGPPVRRKDMDDAAYEAAKQKAEQDLERRRQKWATEHAALCAREVVQDLTTFSAPTRFFERRDLDRPDKLRDYFHLRTPDTFYNAYQEDIGDREFVYDGTKYQWSETEASLTIKVPSTAKKFVRVGTDYFKYIKRRNPHNRQLEELLVPWKKGTIVDDNGKHFVNHIQKYDTFTNWPDHMAHQAVMDNCLNAYAPFTHQPDDDAEPPETTLKFMRHIFGEGTVAVPHPKDPEQQIVVKEVDLGLDYLKLLYERPTQMLPILCLISKERGTGKTTWFNYLRHLFGTNCTQVGAKDLESDFNAHYASKLLIIIDEALISKQESVEKLKHLSTSKLISVNTKGVSQYEQPFFGKILVASNNVKNFIRTDEDEVRFWIRKINAIPPRDRDLRVEEKMIEEIPAMLSFLRKRQMATEELFRSWFEPTLLITDALHEIRKHSAPNARKSIEGWVRGIFWSISDLDTMLMATKDIKREVFPGNQRVDDSYINDMMEELGLQRFGVYEKGKSVTTPYSYWRVAEVKVGDSMESILQEVKVKVPGRPWVLHRRAFISEAEESEVLHMSAPPTDLNPKMKERELSAATADVGDDKDLPF